ncbi:ATP-binding protein [Phormidium yuhuli AB48]|uniref:ATP-binding protein n=1 Tax=Phormidium yuhuli AB48 TaxID=2940671 RepID=A0ABY5AQ39_9CYAN|nr:AAA family ATPase [Phormidium yuhuli]USR91021.1 ATP-binding protein [Phormidium yuhuli AB48]
MQIKKLKYYDDEYKWELARVDFLPNLNLLVGVSGVGKTRTLKAIYNLKAIANGASLNGVKWDVCFVGDDGHEYSWMGEFETQEEAILVDDSSDENQQVRLTNERLVCDNHGVLIERQGSDIVLNGQKTPKLSPFESVIELLKQEDQISPVKESLDNIILADSTSYGRFWSLPVGILRKFEKAKLSNLQKSGWPVHIKLSILHRAFPETFNRIKEAFISVFPNVSDVKIETIRGNNIPVELSDFFKEANTVSIKEKGVKDWIQNISSGMLKTLMYISELYLAPENSIILVDEFENSLGVNCLDSVTELILGDKGFQFFITSHHPYIINNVSPAYWKIVTRKGGVVTIKDSEDFHISESRQKAFIDLINVLEDDEDME